ncbi:ParB/RepB/Spo0J family partition protein [Pseudonocardia asaccharolytica]|uniref:Chromosome partitioning protein ParB n=1 Tax=Pseudonocardia asaccharolytica DSM 44247 = NBRC 16224 TaxID=1123024 RepID=A0A511D8Z0_9PSEU|nr:ParB/RepB/Spo0J family partition protein [Pseudonocardia asaccharolytica]GEL19408.1 chromosome partitioning protein ParB [Pseudonocardia asaccharolytica DSM 44247 = NBRC 16224]
MAERKGGLGRGLAALIPTGPPAAAPALGNRPAVGPLSAGSASDGPVPTGRAPVVATEWSTAATAATEAAGSIAGAVYREIDVRAIEPNPQQPRTAFDEESLAELEHSIREFGLLQPIVVRERDRGGYQLVMGERRWRAARRAGLERIPAIVRDPGDHAMLRNALLENIHRVQLNPLEEAAAYEQLLAEFGVTQTELADRIGRSRPVVSNMIRLLKLPVAVQRRVAAGVLSAGHARALLGLDDPGRQEELAARIVAEGMSVRATEEAVLLARRETPTPARAARRKPMHAPGADRLAERLSDRFDTRVRVELGQRKGRIVVEFGSVEDLERIAGMMSPGSAQRDAD